MPLTTASCSSPGITSIPTPKEPSAATEHSSPCRSAHGSSTSRASFAFYNTHGEVDALVAGIRKVQKVFR